MKKHVHFIGICGVAMSALAIAFDKKGWKVTGSDKGFYPPVSTYLKQSRISYYPGWHPEKMGTPDLVIVGNVAGSSNPEWKYVQENNIPYKSYPEAVAEHLIRPNSIVCAGTYGKTTTSTLLSKILIDAEMNPNYMFGALAVSGRDAASLMSASDWSVVEGDEYKSARWDMRPKFAHYSPTHLLLTAIVWDHADIYPTEENYIQTMTDLFLSVPDSGVRVVSQQALAALADNALEKELISYGSDDANDFVYSNIAESKHGLTFTITDPDGKMYDISTSCIGSYMADNITACFAMAKAIGIEADIIIDSIKSFKGIKRRLEKRHSGDITIFDDIAHSPTKAKSTLYNLKSIYNGNIIAVFEPNTGNRKKESIPQYANAFNDADTVIIPRLTSVKIAKDDPNPPFDGKELTDIISQTHKNCQYIPDDNQLLDYLKQNTNKNDVIVFLGSHGFRGMIDHICDNQ